MQVRYEVDWDDRITDIDSDWPADARPGHRAAGPGDAVGHRLWDFICSPGIRWIYGQIMDHVRKNGAPVEFTYRCDSPSMRQTMKMMVEPLNEGRVRYTSSLLAAEPHDRPRYLATTAGSAVTCNICARLRLTHVGDKSLNWKPMDDLLAIGALELVQGTLRVVHGICPDCRDAFSSKLRN